MPKFNLPPDTIEYIRNVLRKESTKWPGRAECLRRSRKKVLVRRGKRGQPIYKYHWQCAKCERWTKNEKSMEVDHIVEIGPFLGDWNEYLWRHFPPDIDRMQVLCIPCHMKKTLAYNSALTKWKRKK